MTPTEQDKELDLYRALQTLKDNDGNYVLSTISFSSQYGLQRLIEFIEEHLQAYTDEIRREVIGDKKISLTDIYGIDWRNNYGYNETQVRDAAIYLQCKQRQALNNLATKWGVKS